LSADVPSSVTLRCERWGFGAGKLPFAFSGGGVQ